VTAVRIETVDRYTPLAQALHWATAVLMLYGIIIVMPVSGYILSTAAARPSPYFWLFYWPQPSLAPGVAHAALQLHLFGQFLVYGFVGLHMLGAGWHILVRRDATLERMLPEQQLASQQH
jgi:cytochrome b561